MENQPQNQHKNTDEYINENPNEVQSQPLSQHVNNLVIQNKTQKFIKRLYNAVNDPSITDIIWSNKDTSILITNKETFRTHTMSKISKTREYTAFLRSLHHYNFQRIKRLDEITDEYFHPYFKKNHEELLHLVRREKDRKKGITNEINLLKHDYFYLHNNLNSLNQNLYSMNDEVVHLRSVVERQEQTINGLMEILSKIFRVGITNDTNQHSLSANLNDVSNLIHQSGNSDGNRRKIPKLEIQHNDNYGSNVKLPIANYVPNREEIFVTNKGKKCNKSIRTQQSNFLTNSRNEIKKNKKEAKTYNMPSIDLDESHKKNLDTDDDFQDLYF